jgi:DNA polymerase III delta prime subunit
MSIAFKEGLKLSPQAVDQFVEGTHSDIRQILNLLSTYRLSRTDLQFDDSKKVYGPVLIDLTAKSQRCREVYHSETLGHRWEVSQ